MDYVHDAAVKRAAGNSIYDWCPIDFKSKEKTASTYAAVNLASFGAGSIKCFHEDSYKKTFLRYT
jgi:hypothetical protein